MSQFKLGWKRDIPDVRDLKFDIPSEETITNLPPSVDLRNKFPIIFNQSNLGSCSAQAIASVIQFNFRLEKHPDFTPSRLFIYYNERDMEGTVKQDAGASIRDGIKSVNSLGVCDEVIWPYDISKFSKKPASKCYKQALLHKALKYKSLSRNLNVFKTCLAQGFPFVCGVSVYNNFMSQEAAKTGIINLPSGREDDSLQGGHAIAIVGYNDTLQRFICRNSWGIEWGMSGYFTLPYEYLTNSGLSADYWVINLMS